MVRSAVFGGTFDPPHNGHLNLIHEAYTHTDVRRIIIVPAFVSAFKTGISSASFDDRIRMCYLLVSDYRMKYPEEDMILEVSDYEGRMGGVSYTSLTVRHFKKEFSYEGKLDLIIGDDHLERLSEWHDLDYLRKNARFLCFRREGGVNNTDLEVVMIDSDVLRASGTNIRGGDESEVPPSVRAYIDEKGLYGVQTIR